MRKQRAILRENWSSIRANIEQVISEKNISPSDFKTVGLTDWEAIENTIIEVFCDFPLHYKYRPGWLSAYSKLETASLSNLVEDAPQYIDELIQPGERVWFFVNDANAKFWYYEGNYRSIKTIIAECCWDEFYIASKKYDWLINMTHADSLLATGKDMPDKLRKIKERIDPVFKKES